VVEDCTSGEQTALVHAALETGQPDQVTDGIHETLAIENETD
jgi:hypothetical protein